MQKISVLISIYKESIEQIEPALQSIFSQTIKDFELIVVLDDPQNIEAEKYLKNLQATDYRIKVLKNEKNIGLGASLNKAVEVASGTYCARMDTEDFSYPDRLAKQLHYLTKNPEIDLLFTQWTEISDGDNRRERRPSAKDVRDIKKNFFLKSILLHPTLMIKTEILKKHPYPAISRPEDWVLFLELIRHDYKFDLLEEVLYVYKVDVKQKYQKVKIYSQNLLPHLFRNIKYFWSNIYFWLYVARITIEFLISRNSIIYKHTASNLTFVWRKLFGK